mmetsp:Transcript_47219/g.75660  ORF Transcript_47219/g.75660 Transcript_47219/m.75660 type:complete len:212 (+) Transcript_47219:298-933(+)
MRTHARFVHNHWATRSFKWAITDSCNRLSITPTATAIKWTWIKIRCNLYLPTINSWTINSFKMRIHSLPISTPTLSQTACIHHHNHLHSHLYSHLYSHNTNNRCSFNHINRHPTRTTLAVSLLQCLVALQPITRGHLLLRHINTNQSTKNITNTTITTIMTTTAMINLVIKIKSSSKTWRRSLRKTQMTRSELKRKKSLRSCCSTGTRMLI